MIRTIHNIYYMYVSKYSVGWHMFVVYDKRLLFGGVLVDCEEC